MISKEIISEAKIYTAYVNQNTKWNFINLKLSNGIEGWGEATLNKSEKIIVKLANNKFRLLIGMSLNQLINEFDHIFSLNDTPNAVLTSAVNAALIDLIAQNKNISVANELGGVINDEVEVYANFNRRTIDRSPDGMKKSAKFVKNHGFNSFKIAPFDEVFPSQSKLDFHKSISKGLERIDAIRDILGNNPKLMIDCHWRFKSEFIDVLIDEILPFNIYWVECPISENLEFTYEIKSIRNKLNDKGIKLAGLETCITKDHFKPFLDIGCYDVMMPDVKYVGGPLKMMELANLIQSFKVEFSPHNPSGPICHAHSLQVCGAVKSSKILEHQFDESPLFNELVDNQLPEIRNGKIKLSNSSGIGVKINKSLEFCFINKKLNLDTNRNNVFDNIVDLSTPDSKL